MNDPTEKNGAQTSHKKGDFAKDIADIEEITK
jgi:hypothetical protein